MLFDAIVVGAGPAGLSAALLLARCRRRVILCDDGRPRNAQSQALHGFLTRDGTPPAELLRLGREELLRYGVQLFSLQVAAARLDRRGFEVTFANGPALNARKLILATGVEDLIPEVPGLRECYGRTVFHCPYCDAWEVRDSRLAVYGRGTRGAKLALALRTWAGDITWCPDGAARISGDLRARLVEGGIRIREARVRRIEHESGRLRRIVFVDGEPADRDAMFLAAAWRPRSDLANTLGCAFTRRGTVKTSRLGATAVPGLYVVGDASHDVQLAIVAAAEGAKAGVAINMELQTEAAAEAGLKTRPTDA